MWGGDNWGTHTLHHPLFSWQDEAPAAGAPPAPPKGESARGGAGGGLMEEMSAMLARR